MSRNTTIIGPSGIAKVARSWSGPSQYNRLNYSVILVTTDGRVLYKPGVVKKEGYQFLGYISNGARRKGIITREELKNADRDCFYIKNALLQNTMLAEARIPQVVLPGEVSPPGKSETLKAQVEVPVPAGNISPIPGVPIQQIAFVQLGDVLGEEAKTTSILGATRIFRVSADAVVLQDRAGGQSQLGIQKLKALVEAVSQMPITKSIPRAGDR